MKSVYEKATENNGYIHGNFTKLEQEVFKYCRYIKPTGSEHIDEKIYKRIQGACFIVDYLVDQLRDIELSCDGIEQDSVKMCVARAKECLDYMRDTL